MVDGEEPVLTGKAQAHRLRRRQRHVDDVQDLGRAAQDVYKRQLLHLMKPKKQQMHSRDGFMAVALSWILLSLFGAIPYMLTGVLDSYVDAVFETVSGLTTTGSTVFNGVEWLPKSVLFWRSLTQWMGGMGVLVLFLALTPRQGEGAVFLLSLIHI